ncbi:MAG: restriction endonuclease subunit S [Ruminococcus sp.]|nr:restriction endonuclease subunit S [Ruminococcus sp.]
MGKIGDLFSLQMGKTPSRADTTYWNNGDNKWISISDMSTYIKYVEETNETISDKAVHESGIKMVPANTVIMSFKLSIGKTAITSEPVYTNEAIMAFIPNKHNMVLPDYLYYLLSSKNWNTESNRAVMGSTLNKATISQMELSLHPIEEQQKIAAILDKVTDLINLRKKELEKLDLLVKSRFVELFGDPELNPNGWETTTIGAVIQSCEAGWSGNGTQREKKPGEIAVLKVSAVTKGFFVPEECKVLDNQNEIKKYVFPQKGDLLFSRANTREMVGATAVIFQDYPELILPDKLWKIRFVSCANVLYMKYILSHQSISSKFSEASTGTSGSMFNVSMEKFKAIKIPLPSIELQNKFATFVEQTDKSKYAVKKSLEKLETLKKALMQEYFG